jgi:hypothetical protein
MNFTTSMVLGLPVAIAVATAIAQLLICGIIER